MISEPRRFLIKSRSLLAGAIFSALVALLHLGCILFGAPWYRFLGAGERMARLAEAGHWYPAVVTTVIIGLLAIAAVYALSGAGVIARLPLLRPVIFGVGSVYLFRGVAVGALVPYFPGNSLRFWIVTSALSTLAGVLHFIGLKEISSHSLEQQIATMRALAAAPDERLLLTDADVSGWCTAEHLDHLTKVSTSVFRRLSKRDAEPPSRGINVIGRAVLALGWIPRGRGKSPERLHGTRVNRETLIASIDEMERLAKGLDLARMKTPAVPHPKFGGLNPAQALRFVAVHNEHHLRIITDITRAATRRDDRSV